MLHSRAYLFVNKSKGYLRRGKTMIDSNNWYWEKTWNSFRRGTRRIKLSWEGGEAVALIYDEGVPETAAAVLKSLPLDVPVVHAAWSGELVMSAGPFAIPAHREENRTRLPYPGDLTWDPKYGELCFVYGTAEARLPSGENTLVVYGHVLENLEQLVGFCRERRFKGLGTIRMDLL
jgi:hypothetical protein